MSTDSIDRKGPPLFGLPVAGVGFGALWIAGAFAALFTCFLNNYLNRPSVPAIELPIANAALAPAESPRRPNVQP